MFWILDLCSLLDINTAGPSDLVYAQIDLQDKKKTKGKGKHNKLHHHISSHDSSHLTQTESFYQENKTFTIIKTDRTHSVFWKHKHTTITSASEFRSEIKQAWTERQITTLLFFMIGAGLRNILIEMKTKDKQRGK